MAESNILLKIRSFIAENAPSYVGEYGIINISKKEKDNLNEIGHLLPPLSCIRLSTTFIEYLIVFFSFENVVYRIFDKPKYAKTYSFNKMYRF